MEGKIDTSTVRSAANAVLKHVKMLKKQQDKTQLLDKPETIVLQFSLRKMPQPKHKPYLVPLKHSIFEPERGAELCLFVKDPADAFKDKLAENPVPGFTKVIGYTKLRKEYKQYQARRELLQQYDGFFADDRIYPMLPRLLGKVFYGRKKQPFPVRISSSAFGDQLSKARDSTAVFLGFGPCVSVRIALTNFKAEQIVENIQGALNSIVERFPQKWKNVQSIYLKSTSSLPFPLYAALPETLVSEGARALAGTESDVLGDHKVAKSSDLLDLGSDSSDDDFKDNSTARANAEVSTIKSLKTPQKRTQSKVNTGTAIDAENARSTRKVNATPKRTRELSTPATKAAQTVTPKSTSKRATNTKSTQKASRTPKVDKFSPPLTRSAKKRRA